MFSVPYSSDDDDDDDDDGGSSSQTTNAGQSEPSRPVQTPSVTSTLRKRASALRTENDRLLHEIQVLQTSSQECATHPKQPDDCGRVLDEEHRALSRELKALRRDTVDVFVSGDGDVGIADRAAAYLDKVTRTFHDQLSRIDSMGATTTQHRRTLLLEHLKKLFERNVRRTDKWISLVIRAK